MQSLCTILNNNSREDKFKYRNVRPRAVKGNTSGATVLYYPGPHETTQQTYTNTQKLHGF